jgi:hypothetical protein
LGIKGDLKAFFVNKMEFACKGEALADKHSHYTILIIFLCISCSPAFQAGKKIGFLVSSVGMGSSTALACVFIALYLTQAKATLPRIFFAVQESFPHLTRKNQKIQAGSLGYNNTN